MSKVLHRRPTLGWSVVLLSTLLLSPVTAQAFLHALCLTDAAVRSSSASASDAAPTGQTPDAESPRRRADDEESLLHAARTAARDGDETRIDPAPGEPVYGSGASAPAYVLLPAQSVLLVPDEAPAGKAARPVPDALLCSGISRRSAAPRAPPV